MELTYRLANKNDCELYYQWANDDEVRKNSFTSGAISFEDHEVWFQKMINSEKAVLLLFYFVDDPVGQLRINIIDDRLAQIGYSVAADWRGKRIGEKMLVITKELFHKIAPGLTLKGIVKKNNLPSVRSFELAGYKETEEVLMGTDTCFVYYSE